MAGERTEAATPKHRQEARKRGQVARSHDLTAGIALTTGFAVLIASQGFFRQTLESAFRLAYADLHRPDKVFNSIFLWMAPIVRQGAVALAPICAATALAALATQLAQVGFLVSSQAVRFDLNRINPLEGIKRLVTMRTAVELLKGIVKCLILGGIIAHWTYRQRLAFMELAGLPVSVGVAAFADLCRGLATRVCVALLAIGAIDYFYQRFEYNRSLRMTKQQVKEEYREQEGDPQLKARVRQIQREMARRRMVQDVAAADVVITNPTHLAVALRYDPEKHAAPVVVAKGRLLLAEKIRTIARRHHVPIVRNPPLARALYRMVKVGHTIPETLFRAVAEVLAFIYRTYGRKF
ncbi:MAG TPA: flagellar biosynthesis protein FlhB [Armatimonadota bacterium]|jgi:flagellar biosynthetic protein FlhB|nr:flagellar biosynthesis protein FlhB [Armatimonadota bacterium]HPT97582.1 flagellar biosynthesis protein FlhB [Armatimonadota bacterium]